jgi:hypothetical protein
MMGRLGRRLDEIIFGRDMKDMAARVVGCQIVVVLLPIFGIGFLAGRCR